jgi:hypothetical protein
LKAEEIEQKLSVVKNSRLLHQFVEMPRAFLLHSVAYSRVGINKARYYFGVFLESNVRRKLDEILIWSWSNGKFVVLRVLRFVREAYFEKSDLKALKSKK